MDYTAAEYNKQLAPLLLFGIYFAFLYHMGNKKQKGSKDKISQQNELSNQLMTVFVAAGGGLVAASEFFFGIVKKIYRAHTFLFPLSILLIVFSFFMAIVARWITEDNIRNRTSMTNYARALQKKSGYNTAGISIFLTGVSLFILLAIQQWVK